MPRRGSAGTSPRRTAFRSRKRRQGRAACRPIIALNLGAIGVTGTAAANRAAEAADVVLAVGTRLQDFTTGSRTLFRAGSSD
jgi:3D-(3,5/4)-trihydroxycyclohexane-1,2-dione acylhydrolase (decyclizing)